jgi:hypothetical protein
MNTFHNRLAIALLMITIWTVPAFCGPIHQAAHAGDSAKVKALLKENPDLHFSRDNLGLIPLHWATWDVHKALVEFLLANKAEVNAKDGIGRTPLYYAAGHKDIVELLLTHGATVNIKRSDDMTPLYLAAMQGDLVKAKELLKSNPGLASGKNSNALYWAAEHGYKDVAALLLAHHPVRPSNPDHLLRFYKDGKHVDVFLSTSDGSIRVAYQDKILAEIGEVADGKTYQYWIEFTLNYQNSAGLRKQSMMPVGKDAPK